MASVDETIKEYIEEFTIKHDAFRCFDLPQLIILNEELRKYNESVTFVTQFFLPDLTQSVKVNDKITIKVYDETNIATLYDDKRFGMALGYNNTGIKRDVIAIVGFINGDLVGVVGASNDSSTM